MDASSVGGVSVANPLPGGELAAFVAAVESATLQAAADELQLTQSAVTKRIQSLEQRVGGRLLERGRFGVRPTSLGQTLYCPAKRALDAIAGVEEVAQLSQSRDAIELRLSASLTLGEFLLPGWLGEFRALRPDVHPQLEIVNSRRVIEAVRERGSEVGFVEGLDSLKGLEAVTVARDTLVVVVAAEHRWARRGSVQARELRGDAYLTREAASGTRAVAEAALARAGVELIPTMQAASFETLKRALTGGGFTIVSELAIETERRMGSLVGVPIQRVDLRRELRAIRRRQPGLTGAARAFWRWLTSHPAALTTSATT
jgi:DNA-binding transcriptional LysR family regulator